MSPLLFWHEFKILFGFWIWLLLYYQSRAGQNCCCSCRIHLTYIMENNVSFFHFWKYSGVQMTPKYPGHRGHSQQLHFRGGGEGTHQRTPTVLCPPSVSVVQNRSLPQRLENQPHPFSRRKRLNTKAWVSEHKHRVVMSHHVTLIWIEPHCWLNRVQTPWVDIPPSRLYSLYSHRYIRSSKTGNSLLKWACLYLNCFSHPIQTNPFLPIEISPIY